MPITFYCRFNFNDLDFPTLPPTASVYVFYPATGKSFYLKGERLLKRSKLLFRSLRRQYRIPAMPDQWYLVTVSSPRNYTVEPSGPPPPPSSPDIDYNADLQAMDHFENKTPRYIAKTLGLSKKELAAFIATPY